MKYWINKEKGSDNLIIISDTVIYCSNYSDSKLREFEIELMSGVIPKSLTGTPFGYIKTIESGSNSNKIKIYYGKKNDLKMAVKNEEVRKEIFDYLKQDGLNQPLYEKKHLSRFEASLKPLLVLMIVAGIIYFIASIATDMEAGVEYEARGLGNLIIGVAQVLGTKGVIAAGAIPLLILIYKVVKSIQRPPVIERLHYARKK